MRFLQKTKIPIIYHVLEGRFFFLLVFILGYIAILPLLENFAGLRVLMDIFLTATILSGTYAVSPERHNRIIAAALAVPMFASLWINHLLQNSFLTFGFHLFFTLFMIYSIVILLNFVFKTEKITRDVIYAAIVVYLFIGMLWANFYAVFELLTPGSFSFPGGSPEQRTLNFTYYSYITLTTLGYGDITPLTAKTKSFSMLEALIGQLYLTVLIARLVGLHISHKRKND